MMIFDLRPKRISKPKHTGLKFDLEKLKDPNVLKTFSTMMGGKFAPLTAMNNKDSDMDSMITTFNAAVTETAREILGKQLQKKKHGLLQKFLICAKKERTEEEKIRTWRIWEIQGREEQHQEVHEKRKRILDRRTV